MTVQLTQSMTGRTVSNETGKQSSSPNDVSIVSLVNRILERASASRASDVHLEPRREALHVRFRIDGSLVDVDTLPMVFHGALVSRLKIMAGMNIVERRRPQDGQFTALCAERSLDVRLATLSTIHGEKMVLRLLDQKRTTRGLAELGMPARIGNQWKRLIATPHGLVLCAGPTGSGKTTTLYASLTEMDVTDRNVTTIEDPVEYVVPGINQVRTNDQAGLTFASGLRALLRQDPDVILIGELRDEETARLGIQAALTGHFVLSSIHATDAAGALQRLIDMGVEPFLVSSSLTAVIGQRLVRRVCSSCTRPDALPQEMLESLERRAPDHPVNCRRGVGCDRCSNTGYLERVGVYEVLRITPGVRRLLMLGADAADIRRQAVDEGMVPLGDAAMDLVRSGVTTVDEVVRTLGEMSPAVSSPSVP